MLIFDSGHNGPIEHAEKCHFTSYLCNSNIIWQIRRILRNDIEEHHVRTQPKYELTTSWQHCNVVLGANSSSHLLEEVLKVNTKQSVSHCNSEPFHQLYLRTVEQNNIYVHFLNLMSLTLQLQPHLCSAHFTVCALCSCNRFLVSYSVLSDNSVSSRLHATSGLQQQRGVGTTSYTHL